ncbi:hypothetical protein [Marinobacter subterrani]|uniref:hypothetical protein n=1 Tax=Marinobacter subterrani TaxID=1658765 RepID=UPI0023546AB9|nr:hypothetical protein [Marinobacter subterrani]
MFILDIEASSLNDDSYPIEIAWCDLNGSNSVAMLINPDSAGDWDEWDSYAEMAIHGLSREQCCKEGENVVRVARIVGELLEENPVFSDAHWQDQKWLERLFESVGKRPPAKLIPLEQLVPLDRRFILAAKLATPSRPHRALADCQFLTKLVREVRADT